MSVDEIVRDITENMANDGSANYIQLTEQIGTVGTITSVILGLMVYIIIIGLPIVMAIEVMYINIPVLQTSFEKLTMRTTGKLNQILGLVIRDARIAVKRANTIETGKSVNQVYFGIKVKAVFIAVLSVGLVIGAGPYILELVMSIAKAVIEGFRKAF